MTKDNKDFSSYLSANLEEYKGKWIILCDEHIIASGDNIKEIITEAEKKHPKKKLLLARVPQEGTMIL
jgi:orotate phosphoribosyltransferase-like protein